MSTQNAQCTKQKEKTAATKKLTWYKAQICQILYTQDYWEKRQAVDARRE